MYEKVEGNRLGAAYMQDEVMAFAQVSRARIARLLLLSDTQLCNISLFVVLITETTTCGHRSADPWARL